MEFITAKEACELMGIGLQKELKNIEKEIRKAALNKEKCVYYGVDFKYSVDIIEFLESKGYDILPMAGTSANCPTLYISWD